MNLDGCGKIILPSLYGKLIGAELLETHVFAYASLGAYDFCILTKCVFHQNIMHPKVEVRRCGFICQTQFAGWEKEFLSFNEGHPFIAGQIPGSMRMVSV